MYPTNSDGSAKDPNVKDGRAAPGAENAEDGMELSQREKIWKEQMEKMRKRIESDPYEAIFGKRFEPFWSPLVPSWMREEMGLPVWKMKGEVAEAAKKAETEAQAEVKKHETISETEAPRTTASPKKVEKPVEAPKVDSTPVKPTSYAYASSTSWDSWSNKTRRVEWDSMSGQTKKYEYDPISNRMVQVESPKAADAKSIGAAPQQTKKTDDTSISIPVKQSSSELRQSIPIPPPLSQPSHSIPIGFSTTTTTTSVGPLKSTAIASDVSKGTAVTADVPKSSAVAKVPESQQPRAIPKPIDSMTAEDVRANMGKPRTSPSENPKLAQTQTSVKTQLGALLMERHISKDLPVRNRHGAGLSIEKSQWDKAELNVFYDKELENLNKKKEKLLKDERGLFHIERQKRELMKLDTRIKELVARVEKLNDTATPASHAFSQEQGSVGLQSSLDRMQSKSTPRAALDPQDPDDSAAHESTEPIPTTAPNVPRDWANQADLLQAARVRRTAIARSYPSGSSAQPAASITPAEISARKRAAEAKRAADEAKAAEEIAKIKAEKTRLEREQKLEKANAMLADEIKEQKFKMQAHENRYAHKIRALRGELEVAYKQSAVHGEKHVERIRGLEAELEMAQKAVGEAEVKELESKLQAREKRLTDKIRALRGELDIAYKQSAVHGEKHVDHIRDLEARLKKAQQTIEEVAAVDGTAGGKFTNWYRQATEKVEAHQQALNLLKEPGKKGDKELVKEIRKIYEDQYGVIGEEHRQPSHEAVSRASDSAKGVVEVETDVDLGEALAKYEKEQSLKQRLAAEEREAHEGIKLVDDKMPRLIPTSLANTNASNAEAVKQSVQWEIPPRYKVLAYDSGNDRISTAVTTSNWTSSETPISISEALGQLYAPARFVGEFAELQREGYQVIYGSKELLVFRKVADSGAGPTGPALEDHGLVAGENHPDHWVFTKAPAKAESESASASVNPVDGTSAAAAKQELLLTKERLVERLDEIARSTPAKEALPDESDNVFDTETDWRHYPRVKRDEFPHFTGTKRKWRSKKRHAQAVVEHSEPKYEEDAHKWSRARARMERQDRKSRFWRRVVGATIVFSGGAYLVGSVAEKRRKEEEAMKAAGASAGEEWAKKLEKSEKEASKWMWK